MKHYLLAAGLTTTSALAQTTPPVEPEATASFAGASAVVVHTPNGTRVACATATRALQAASYVLGKRNKSQGGVSTQAKLLEDRLYLQVQVVALPEAGGSTLTFRGIYSYRAAPAWMAHVIHRYLPVQCSDTADSLTQRAWSELQRMVLAAYPGARVGYR